MLLVNIIEAAVNVASVTEATQRPVFIASVKKVINVKNVIKVT